MTAVGYGTNGWLTMYPAGQNLPLTSTLNFGPSEYAMANGTVVRLDTNDQVCVSVGTVNSAVDSSHVILDAEGYLTASALAGLAGLLANATAVILNLTAVGDGSQGWLTAYPAGQAVPATSTLNFDTSEYAVANGAILGLGSNGQVCVKVGTVNSAAGDSQVIVDVVGYVLP